MFLNKETLIECLNKMPIVNEDKGKLDRGWYICMNGSDGTLYLDNNGVITWGVNGFWKTKEDATKFLMEWEAV